MEVNIGTGLQRQRGFDVAVIGGGVAGLTAAWSAARYGLSAVLFEGAGVFGGQIGTLGKLEDYPAAQASSGVDLATTLVDSARQAGAIIVEQNVMSIAHDGALLELAVSSERVRARNVVVATGARLRKLNVPGEQAFEGRGVSQCATCDGPFFKGKNVVVVGGGDAALQEALTLAATCESVSVVVRGALKARQAFIDAAATRANLQFVWDAEVVEILGQNGVNAARLRHLKSGAITELPCFGIFPYIGSEPNTELLDGLVALDNGNRIVTDANLRCSVPNIYAIGAAREGHGGALVSAAGDAARVIHIIASQLRP